MGRFCGSCGAPAEDGGSFCGSCGKSLRQGNQLQQQQQQQGVLRPTSEPPKRAVPKLTSQPAAPKAPLAGNARQMDAIRQRFQQGSQGDNAGAQIAPKRAPPPSAAPKKEQSRSSPKFNSAAKSTPHAHPGHAMHHGHPREHSSTIEHRVCKECRRPIDGDHIDALGHPYHPNCFFCEECRGPLGGSFCEKGGKPFCAACYDEKFLDKCVKCKQPITGEGARDNKGRYYHTRCFCCAECNAPLTEEFYWVKDQARCKTCTDKGTGSRMGKICAGCGGSLGAQAAIETGPGEFFHVDCFRCSSCRQPIVGKYAMVSGKRMCLKCKP